MPRPKENFPYNYFIGKLVILSVFILIMALAVPFFYGWLNGMAHKDICGFVGVKSVWSCGLIVRDPGVLWGYFQFSQADKGSQIPPVK